MIIADELWQDRNFQIRFQYTVPGQVFYNSSRLVVLKGVDGLVMVVDSDPDRFDSNLESLFNLEENLKVHGYRLSDLPHVIQLNKRDLPNVVDGQFLSDELNHYQAPVWSSAIEGLGVAETLKRATMDVVSKFKF